MKRIYTSIYAHDEDHHVIDSLKDLRTSGDYSCFMGLYFNGVPVGRARLEIEKYTKKYLHTESVRLYKKFRRQGHGIELYRAIIEHARRIGAVRVYSSRILNKFSTRMWEVKLPAIYDVKRTHQKCPHPCRHCRKVESRFYINL